MSPIKPKYVVHPGWIVSQMDGGLHYIGFLSLCLLAKVDPDDCIDASIETCWKGYRMETLKTLQHLRPNRNGMYLTPK